MTWLIATVVGIRDETPAARSITLDVPNWPGHVAGQHVDVRLTAADGYSAVRSYSIASAPQPSRQIELTVERLENGEVSPYLTQQLAIGDRLEVRGPVGRWFVWGPEQIGHVQLVAGGSGIVPLMAMIRSRIVVGSSAPFRLLYSVREPQLVYYKDELNALSDDKQGFSITYAYTRKAPAGWPRPAGRVDAALTANAIWPSAMAPTSYVCGPTSFVENITELLIGAGYARDRIKTERFGATGGRN